jgi:hypothetical protein
LSKLQAIAARYSAAIDAAQSFNVDEGDRLHTLRCIMRFGLAWNQLASLHKHSGKDRDAYTDDEWRAYVAKSSAFFNANLRDFGSEEGCINYIRHCMSWIFPELKRENPSDTLWKDRLDVSGIPNIIEWFVALPDKEVYGYKA